MPIEKMRQVKLKALAYQVIGTPGVDERCLTNAVALAEYCGTISTLDLTTEEIEFMLEVIDSRLGQKPVQAIKAITVIDCRDARNFILQSVKTYPATPEGRKAAEATFREWADWGYPKFTDEEWASVLEDRKCESGDGFFAMIEST